MAALSMKILVTFPFTNDNAIENSSFGSRRNTIGEVRDIPEFLVKMYLKNAKNDGTLKGNSKQIPPTVHGFIGQGNSRFIIFLYNLRLNSRNNLA